MIRADQERVERPPDQGEKKERSGRPFEDYILDADKTNYTAKAEQHSTIPRSKPPRKWQRVLSALLEGKSFHRFWAERELGDHCLHTTISALEARGVRIDRRDEAVTGRFGVAHVKSYSLTSESQNIDRARELLGHTEAGRAD